MGDCEGWEVGGRAGEVDEEEEETGCNSHQHGVVPDLGTGPDTHMTAKQVHCIPTCMIPSRPAKHENPLISRQHAMS